MKIKLLIILFTVLELTVNAQLVVSVTSATICAGNCAVLTASVSGGTSPYTYFWSTGEITQTIVVCPLMSTTYTVTVIDATSSTVAATASVSVNSTTASAIANPITITSGNSSTLTASGGGTYNWNSMTTINPIVVSPTVNTGYCVTVTNANGCTDTACVTVYVTPTGIQSYTNEHSISIFPNPFSTQSTLQTNNVFKSATLTIYNSFGQMVRSLVISHLPLVIERGNLASGLYFIRLTEDNETFAIEKLIITDR